MMRVSEVMQPFHYQKYDKYKDVSLEVTHQDHVDSIQQQTMLTSST